MTTEYTRDQKSIRAAMLLSLWLKTHRRTVSVTYDDHQVLLYKLEPIRVVIEKIEENKEPKYLFVIHNKEKATKFLESEYGLHNACSLR